MKFMWFCKKQHKKSKVTQKEHAIEKYDKVLYGFEHTFVYLWKQKLEPNSETTNM